MLYIIHSFNSLGKMMRNYHYCQENRPREMKKLVPDQMAVEIHITSSLALESVLVTLCYEIKFNCESQFMIQNFSEM